MKIEVKEQKKNPLMDRDEYVINIDHSGKPTPSRHDILKEVAKVVKESEDVIIIDKILSQSGASVSVVSTFIYKKKDSIPIGKIEKMKRRMTKKKEEATPVPAPVEEAASEEKPATEEVPKEEGSEAPVEEKPADTQEEKPSEEAPKEEPGKEVTEEKPSEEKPAETKKEAPVEEKVEEAKVEEKKEEAKEEQKSKEKKE